MALLAVVGDYGALAVVGERRWAVVGDYGDFVGDGDCGDF